MKKSNDSNYKKSTKIKPTGWRKSKQGLFRDKIKDKPFIDEVTDFKRDNDILAYYYAHTGLNAEHPRTINRISNCRKHIEAVKDSDGKGHIIKTFGCGNRFCPACSRALAMKNSLMLTAVCSYLTDKKVSKKFDCYERKFDSCQFIFATLTVPNCTGEELPDVINLMTAAYKRLFERKEMRAISLGTVRKLEVTLNLISDKGAIMHPYSPVEGVESDYYDRDCYNLRTGIVNKLSDNKDPYALPIAGYTFHPHFHVMIAVRNCYGSNGHRFLTTERLSQLWSESMRSDRSLVVDIRKVGGDGSVLEVSKYIAKKEDYLLSAQVFGYFYRGLYRRKMLAYSGIFKSCVKLFKDGELDKYIPNEYTPIDSYVHIRYLDKAKTVDFYESKSGSVCLVGNEQYRDINNPRRTVFESVLKENRYLTDADMSLKEIRDNDSDLLLYITDVMALHHMCLVYEELRFKRNGEVLDPGFYFYRMSKQEYDDYLKNRDVIFFDSLKRKLFWTFKVTEYQDVISESEEDDAPNLITGNLEIVAKSDQMQLEFFIPTFTSPWDVC